ncbi:MAG: right-handed parallel beta-helix repeat-containing protein, partial [Planctomycetota bacterium]
MMKRFAAATLALYLAAVSLSPAAYDPSWSKSQCDIYSFHGLGERYVYGGNKGWLDNDTWDDPAVEGVDCASYVCRCLALPEYVAESTPAPYPYTTVHFYAGVANTTQVTSINELEKWDLWVYTVGSNRHTGLFKEYSGSYIITREARSADKGVIEGRFSKQYLIDMDTRYWRRENWSSSAPQLPTVQTAPATDISHSSATLNAVIVSEGDSAIDQTRFDWGTTEACSDGWITGILSPDDTFHGTLTGLEHSTMYYFKASAHNSNGWSSGAVMNFNTGFINTGPVLYVDQSAAGSNNGSQWTDAYTDLQTALASAALPEYAEDCTIYIAQGTYTPGNDLSDRFTLPENTAVYGGFHSGGCDFANRNPALYKTTLSGRIDETRHNRTAIVMGDNSLLDGVEVSNSSEYGVYAADANFVMDHCTVTRHDGVGIYVENATPVIKNCIVSKSAQGITILNPIESPSIFNCTIVQNDEYGVSFSDNHNSVGDPNDLDYPDIQNSIVYYNNGMQLVGLNPDRVAAYSCIQDCNELPGTTNINDAPQFAYADANDIPLIGNYHLVYNSPCKNMGNPNHNNDNVGLFDMDKLERIVNDCVDIGADEIDCADVSNPLDLNADGFVNLYEFNK